MQKNYTLIKDKNKSTRKTAGRMCGCVIYNKLKNF